MEEKRLYPKLLVIRLFFYTKGVYWSVKPNQNGNIKSILFDFLIVGDLVDMRKKNSLDGLDWYFAQIKNFL